MPAYTWGSEDPTRRIASARDFPPPSAPPSAYNTGLLQSASRARAPDYARPSARAAAAWTQRALLETGEATADNGHNTSPMPTPSSSAWDRTSAPPPPSSYNTGLLERSQRVSPYTGIRAAIRVPGGMTVYSSDDDTAISRLKAISDTDKQADSASSTTPSDKPSLDEIATAAEQLSAVVSDSSRKDALDEIRQQATVLSVKRLGSPQDFNVGQPGERAWQLLADTLRNIARELSASDLQGALEAPATRARVTDNLAGLSQDVAELGMEVRSAEDKQAYSTGIPRTPAQGVIALKHFYNADGSRRAWFQSQAAMHSSPSPLYATIDDWKNFTAGMTGIPILRLVTRAEIIRLAKDAYLGLPSNIARVAAAVDFARFKKWNLLTNRRLGA